MKTSTLLLELGKCLLQAEVPLWPPWEVPGSFSEELLDSNLATLLSRRGAALRFPDGV